MIKNGVYFIVIALLVGELFKSNPPKFQPCSISICTNIPYLVFYITLCPHCDVTSHLICVTQNQNRECYHNNREEFK